MLFDDPDDMIDDDGDDYARGAATAMDADGLPQPRFAIDITGHATVEARLVESIASGKIPHAMIFAGPRGIGKSTMAYRLVRTLIGIKPVDDGPSLFGDPVPPAMPDSLSADPESQSSRLIASGGHPDLMVLERQPDEMKGGRLKDIDVGQIREIPGFLHMTPAMGGWRAVIVDDADTMTRSAQNAILKVLEEPPANSILILIAHRPGMLISTIRSRARVFDFSPLERSDFDSLMKRAAPGVTQADIDATYNISGGSIGVAQQLLQDGALKSLHQVTALLQTWPDVSWRDVHLMAEVLGGKGNDENAMNGFQDMLLWICETMVRTRAKGILSLPPPINGGPYPAMLSHYSLEGWSMLCDALRTHFMTVKYGTLDRRHAVFGAFSILKSGETL